MYKNIYNRLKIVKLQFKVCLQHELTGLILSQTNLHDLTII